ncbi:hypothetical protein diail_2162 [Diaporthe ilicicola]|nr:hypothetical protein diail_2162 [Diaporthe ilicicola]
MASKQDIEILLEKISKVASQNDEVRSQVLDGLQSLQLWLERPEDLNLCLLNLQLQLTAAQIGQDLKLFQILQESPKPLNVDDLPGKTRTEPSFLLNDTAIKKAFSTKLTGFARLRSDPRRFEAFQQAMIRRAPGAGAVVPFDGFSHQCAALAAAFPALRGRLVLQDMAHDFFGPQPIKGARFYYLRNVLHD